MSVDNFITKLGSLGIDLGFAAEIDLSSYKQPILSLSTDGVGTKTTLLKERGLYSDLGRDLVAMVFNDIICTGAQPIGFLDYIAIDELDESDLDEFIEGILDYCNQSHAKLLGGETAIMNTLGKGDIEVVGFGVGVREKEDTFAEMQVGDLVVGLPSSGFHSNGWTTIRQVAPLLPKGWIDSILKPTRLYVPYIMFLKERCNIKAIANITGGGIQANLDRVIPSNLRAVIDFNSWNRPRVFKEFQYYSYLKDEKMYQEFNMGIGMILVVNKYDAMSIPDGIIIGQIKWA